MKYPFFQLTVGLHIAGMGSHLLTTVFFTCVGIVYNGNTKNQSTPDWLPYIDFHLQRPLREYFSNSRHTLLNHQKVFSSIFPILDRYARLSKQRCDISFCKSPCSYQNKPWHSTTLTWPCGVLCHDSIDKTASCEWRIKLNRHMRLNITILNMQVPYGSFDRACNKRVTDHVNFIGVIPCTM